VIPAPTVYKTTNIYSTENSAQVMASTTGYTYTNEPNFTTSFGSLGRTIWNASSTTANLSNIIACYDLNTATNIYGYALFATSLVTNGENLQNAHPQQWTIYGSNDPNSFLDANLNNNSYWTNIETVSLPYPPTVNQELIYYKHSINRIQYTTEPDAPVINATPQDTEINVTFDTPYNGGNTIIRYEYSIDSTNYISTFPAIPVGNQFTISNVINGTTYFVTLRAVNGYGNSAASNIVSVVPCTLPKEPTISKIVALDGAVEIVFVPPVDDGGSEILGYEYAFILGEL